MHLPKVPFITKKTKFLLKWKTLIYLVSLKEGRGLFYCYVLKSPKLFFRFLFSIISSKKVSIKKNNYFFYGYSHFDEIKSSYREKNTILILGFSYCQKPLNCPAGRFNDQCHRDLSHFSCKDCIIGEVKNKPEFFRLKIIIIPTFLYLAEFLCKEQNKMPKKNFIFLITACELSFKMFERYASLLKLKGIGIRLQGRICNTFDAFKLAERGIKPGLTFITSSIKNDIRRLLNILES